MNVHAHMKISIQHDTFQGTLIASVIRCNSRGRRMKKCFGVKRLVSVLQRYKSEEDTTKQRRKEPTTGRIKEPSNIVVVIQMLLRREDSDKCAIREILVDTRETAAWTMAPAEK